MTGAKTRSCVVRLSEEKGLFRRPIDRQAERPALLRRARTVSWRQKAAAGRECETDRSRRLDDAMPASSDGGNGEDDMSDSKALKALKEAHRRSTRSTMNDAAVRYELVSELIPYYRVAIDEKNSTSEYH